MRADKHGPSPAMAIRQKRHPGRRKKNNNSNDQYNPDMWGQGWQMRVKISCRSSSTRWPCCPSTPSARCSWPRCRCASPIATWTRSTPTLTPTTPRRLWILRKNQEGSRLTGRYNGPYLSMYQIQQMHKIQY